MSEIPIPPNDTGSSGTQEALGGELVPFAKESPFKGLPITQTIEGLAATHSRNLGGEVAANLISGSFAQLSHDLQSTKQELSVTREQLGKAQLDLSNARLNCAVLKDRSRTDSQTRYLRNFCIFAGTTFLGIGIELYKNSFDKFGLITGCLGTLLLVFGWVPLRRKAQE